MNSEAKPAPTRNSRRSLRKSSKIGWLKRKPRKRLIIVSISSYIRKPKNKKSLMGKGRRALIKPKARWIKLFLSSKIMIWIMAVVC